LAEETSDPVPDSVRTLFKSVTCILKHQDTLALADSFCPLLDIVVHCEQLKFPMSSKDIVKLINKHQKGISAMLAKAGQVESTQVLQDSDSINRYSTNANILGAIGFQTGYNHANNYGSDDRNRNENYGNYSHYGNGNRFSPYDRGNQNESRRGTGRFQRKIDSRDLPAQSELRDLPRAAVEAIYGRPCLVCRSNDHCAGKCFKNPERNNPDYYRRGTPLCWKCLRLGHTSNQRDKCPKQR